MKTKRRKAPQASRRGRTHADRVRAGGKSQKKGANFEVQFGEFIWKLAQEFGLRPAENRRQQAGVQYGSDWHFLWKWPDGTEVRWYFQCKDYRPKTKVPRAKLTKPDQLFLLQGEPKVKLKTIDWKKLAGDLGNVEMEDLEIDYWVLVSPLGVVSNPAKTALDRAKERKWYRFKIDWWTVDKNNVGTLFALDRKVYKQIYGVAPRASQTEMTRWKEDWKEKLLHGPAPGAFNKAYYIDAFITDKEPSRTHFIPLQARLLKKESQTGPLPESTEGSTLRPAPVLGLLESGKSFLLVGEFGSGKTFALEEHALNICRSTIGVLEEKGRQVLLPVFISLKEYELPSGALWTLITRAIDYYQQTTFEKAHTERLLGSYPSVVLFDGFNEVRPARLQRELEGELAKFIRDFPHIQVILTSRLGAAPAKRIDLPIYAVQPLPWSQVEEEIQKHYVQDGGEICRRLGDERYKTLRVMLTNPFSLVAFLTWRQTNRELPTTVRDLYETLLEKRIKKTQQYREPFDRVLTHRILTQAGVKMTESDRVVMQESDFWDVVMAKMPIPIRRSSREVVDDVLATGILKIRDEYVSFFHEEIQYYYGGPALLAEQPLDEILKERKYDNAVIHGILSFTGQELWLKLKCLAECDPDLAKKLLRYVTLDETARNRLKDLALRWIADPKTPFGLKARWTDLLQALYSGEDIQRRFPQDASGKPIDWQNLLNRPSPFPRIFVKKELDELMDEIDEVLEENAEEFVRSFVSGPPPWRARREPRLTPLSRIRPDQVPDPSLRDLLTLGMQLLRALPDRQAQPQEYVSFLVDAEYAGISHTEPMFSVGVRVATEYCRQLGRYQRHRDYNRGDRERLAYRLRLYPCREAVALLADLLKDEDGDVAYVAGESLRIMGTPSALKALLGALEDVNPSVRSVAASVLSRVPIQRVFKSLYQKLQSEMDPRVIRSLLESLSIHDPDQVTAFILRRLQNPKEDRKAALLGALIKAGLTPDRIRPILRESFRHHELTQQVIEYLSSHSDPELRDAVLPFLTDSREEVVAGTLAAISQFGDSDLIISILPLLAHHSWKVRRAAAFAIHSLINKAEDSAGCRDRILTLGGQILRSRIVDLLADPETCQAAIYAARALGLAEAREQLTTILATSKDWLLVGNAAEALEKIDPSDVTRLVQILSRVGRSGKDLDSSSLKLDLKPERIKGTLRVLGAWKCVAAVAPIRRFLEKGPSELVTETCSAAMWCLSLIAGDWAAIDALAPMLAKPLLRDAAYDVIDAIERRLRIRKLAHLAYHPQSVPPNLKLTGAAP